MGEVNERIARNLVGETGAAIAKDATLPVEEYEVTDGDRLFVVTLFFTYRLSPGPWLNA